MQMLSILLVMLQAAPDSSAQARGWQGNLYLQNNQLPQAQRAYEHGIDLYRDGRPPDGVYHGLQNNLGLALHGQGDFARAQQSFGTAAAAAAAADDAARSMYNAGNSAFGARSSEEALDHYRSALLADPQNDDARFNYEYVKRQLQQSQQQNDDSTDPDDDSQDQRQEQENGDESQQEQSPEQENPEQEPQPQDQQTEESSPAGEEEPATESETPMSHAEAERILQALENEEKELLREVQKMEGRPRRVTKDW